jgi:hypothetical protein
MPTFTYTGAAEDYIVPSGIGFITVEVWGAQGGTVGANAGGQGGYVKADFLVTPGETLRVRVGGAGDAAQTAGWNGGGTGGTGANGTCAGGGGGSDVRKGGDTLADRIIVGGGGSGASNSFAGMAGGLPNGGPYTAVGTTIGQGGTQSAGGAAGSGTSTTGTPGTFGQGGNGGVGGNAGSGGGGGWYGGGGGGGQSGISNNRGVGGGGSSYYGDFALRATIDRPAYNREWANGVHSGDGQVVITEHTTTSFSQVMEASGGTYTEVDGKLGIHTFTSSGTLTVTEPGVAQALIVGGGGGGSAGGTYGGAGGAGGVEHRWVPLEVGTYTVTVGTGGSAAASGTSSFLGPWRASGGAGGGNNRNNALTGSGGGGDGTAPPAQLGGTNGDQGHPGGNGVAQTNTFDWQRRGGGGGGAGAAGTNATSSGPPAPGGAGYITDLTGTSTEYGQGGTATQSSAAAAAQTPNVGRGGDGGAFGNTGSRQDGGSGVVIVAYRLPFATVTADLDTQIDMAGDLVVKEPINLLGGELETQVDVAGAMRVYAQAQNRPRVERVWLYGPNGTLRGTLP